jgi:hypothetical protein
MQLALSFHPYPHPHRAPRLPHHIQEAVSTDSLGHHWTKSYARQYSSLRGSAGSVRIRIDRKALPTSASNSVLMAPSLTLHWLWAASIHVLAAPVRGGKCEFAWAIPCVCSHRECVKRSAQGDSIWYRVRPSKPRLVSTPPYAPCAWAD